MFISVVIPSLNSPTINQTLDSLEKQSYPSDQFEVIVVGMDKYRLIHENDLIKFVQTDKPYSPAKARNRGVSQARGDIIAFTDADCIADNHWLEIISDRFSNPEVTVLGGGIEFDTINYWTLSDNLSMFHEYLAIQPAGTRSQLPSLNLAIRRDTFERIGGFDEVRYPRPSGEDADLTIRLRREGYKLIFDPSIKIYHASPRHHFSDLLRHSYYQGRYSTKVDPRYLGEDGFPRILHNRLILFLLTPLLAAGACLRIYSSNRNLSAYWYTLPAIYLAKIAWCTGAFASIKREYNEMIQR